MMNLLQLKKPTIAQASEHYLAGNGVTDAEFICQEKSDGEHQFTPWRDCVLNTERMADGDLIINDVLQISGEDVRHYRTEVRLGWLQEVRDFFPPHMRVSYSRGPASELFSTIIHNGGEGVVLKPRAGQFGEGWIKVKRREVHVCRVVGLNRNTGSVDLADAMSGELRGKLPLRGGKFEVVRVGSVLKVEAFGLTAAGMLREARPDADSETSWLVEV